MTGVLFAAVIAVVGWAFIGMVVCLMLDSNYFWGNMTIFKRWIIVFSGPIVWAAALCVFVTNLIEKADGHG